MSDDARWSGDERAVLRPLDTPERIQTWLDAIPYNDEITCRSPRRVLRDRKAHCFEGALFAAAALARIGHAPVLVDLRAAKGRDDDHVIAVFRRHGALGAVGKSNFAGLRYRAPVYRTLRELVMSYFDDYFNTKGERTLRSYSRPFPVRERAFPGWRLDEADLDPIGEALDQAHHTPVASAGALRGLAKVDRRRLESGLHGANEAGLYRL